MFIMWVSWRGQPQSERTEISQLAFSAGGRTPVLDRRRWQDRWRARYLKKVNAAEATTRFWQEIYDATGSLIEVHQKYPCDLGHRKELDP